MQQTETYEAQEVVNKVFIKGRIVTFREVNGTPMFTVVSKNGNRIIFIKMSCAKSVMPENLKNARHARVNIEGHIESYRAKRNEEGKRRIVQHFVADKIEPSKTLTDEIFGVKGKFFEEPCIRVYLKGKLTGIVEEPEWNRYNIDLSQGNLHTTVRVSQKKIDRPVEVNIGDTICALCVVNTPEKHFEEGIKRMEDILVSDLAKVSGDNAGNAFYNFEADVSDGDVKEVKFGEYEI